MYILAGRADDIGNDGEAPDINNGGGVLDEAEKAKIEREFQKEKEAIEI